VSKPTDAHLLRSAEISPRSSEIRRDSSDHLPAISGNLGQSRVLSGKPTAAHLPALTGLPSSSREARTEAASLSWYVIWKVTASTRASDE